MTDQNISDTVSTTRCLNEANLSAFGAGNGEKKSFSPPQWRIDSAATSTYELGNPPDYRGQNCMKKHGVPMSHIARQVPYWDLKVHLCVLCCSGSLTAALFLTGTWAGHQIPEL